MAELFNYSSVKKDEKQKETIQNDHFRHPGHFANILQKCLEMNTSKTDGFLKCLPPPAQERGQAEAGR